MICARGVFPATSRFPARRFLASFPMQNQSRFPEMRSGLFRQRLGAAAVFSSCLLLVAIARAQSHPDEFVIFLGLDIGTEVNGALAPVLAASDATVDVQIEGQRRSFSLRDIRLKTATEPRISRARATLDEMTGDRVYSLNSDPAHDAIAQQMVMETAQEHAQEVRQIRSNALNLRATEIERASGDPLSGISQSDVAAAKLDAVNAASSLDASFTTPAFRSSLPGAIDDNGLFDGFEVRARIWTAEEHASAFGVLRLIIRDPQHPEQPVQKLKFFSLRSLGPTPRKVLVRQMGLPEGFGMDSYSLHIYADGREIPTNVSRNRLEVGVDDAHRFLILRHLQTNRGATIPVQVLPELRPAELSAILSEANRTTAVDLKIDQDGHVTNAVAATGGVSPVPQSVLDALMQLRMLPALLNGQPAASSGIFILEDLLR